MIQQLFDDGRLDAKDGTAHGGFAVTVGPEVIHRPLDVGLLTQWC
jgi:hypothetical protein